MDRRAARLHSVQSLKDDGERLGVVDSCFETRGLKIMTQTLEYGPSRRAGALGFLTMLVEVDETQCRNLKFQATGVCERQSVLQLAGVCSNVEEVNRDDYNFGCRK